MALVEIDSWQTEYESIKRLELRINEIFVKRNNYQFRENTEYQQLTAALEKGIKQFSTELQQLKQTLDGIVKNQTISLAEIAEREQQVEDLDSKLLSLLQRAGLGGGDGKFKTKSGVVIDPTDVQALRQHQAEMLEEQNRGLENLSQTFSRQRALAMRFGEEVDEQNDILDNLANTMDRVNERVHSETGNIGLLDRQDTTWYYWLVIILLLIAIVIVVFL